MHKIVKTVVVDYNHEKCHLNLDYAGIIGRTVAYAIDCLIVTWIVLVFLYFAEVTFDSTRADVVATYSLCCQ